MSDPTTRLRKEWGNQNLHLAHLRVITEDELRYNIGSFGEVLHDTLDDLDKSRLGADLGNSEAWDRYHSAVAEIEALRRLCQDVYDALGGDAHLPCFDGTSWTCRLRRAASGIRLARDSEQT